VAGLAAGACGIPEIPVELGRRLTVMRGVLKTLRIDGSRAREPGVGVRVTVSYRDGWMPGGARGTGPAPAACIDARDRTRNRSGV